MPKRVRMLAEIIGDKCTGCRLCEQVCPTVAISMRERRPEEAGPGKLIAIMRDADCYNAQACLEICPDEAILMRELDEPFEVGVDMDTIDEDAVKELCKKAGYSPRREICYCTTTTAGEIAAAILEGADSPEQVSLKTGARTGCLELCHQPILQLLNAGGHTDMKRNPKTGFQWYGHSATLWEHARPDGSLPAEIVEHFKIFRPDRELEDMAKATQPRRK